MNVCVVNAGIQYYFIEYMLSLGYKIAHSPYNIQKGDNVYCLQELFPLNYGNANFIGLINTEQLTRENWLQKIKNIVNDSKISFTLFDYSGSNVELLKEKCNIISKVIPYCPNENEIAKLKNLISTTEKVCDLAFVGTGDRRLHVINQIRAQGITVNTILSKWGDARDIEVAKCKYLLNIHFADDFQIFEELRCNRWMMSGMKVLSEASLYSDKIYCQENVIFFPISTLVNDVVNFVKNNKGK